MDRDTLPHLLMNYQKATDDLSRLLDC